MDPATYRADATVFVADIYTERRRLTRGSGLRSG